GGGEPLLYEPEQPARERAVAAGPVRQGVEERELELREALARLGGREGAGHLGEVVAGELLLLAGGERRQGGQEGAHARVGAGLHQRAEALERLLRAGVLRRRVLADQGEERQRAQLLVRPAGARDDGVLHLLGQFGPVRGDEALRLGAGGRGEAQRALV